MENSEVMKIGGLLLGLFLLAVITGVTFIGMDYLKETACEQSGDLLWNSTDAECYGLYNNTYNLSTTVTSVTQITVVEAVINTVLALLALVVIMSIFQIVIKTARGFKGGF